MDCVKGVDCFFKYCRSPPYQKNMFFSLNPQYIKFIEKFRFECDLCVIQRRAVWWMIINMNGGVEDEIKKHSIVHFKPFCFFISWLPPLPKILFLALVVGVSFVMFKKIYVDDVLFCLPSHKLWFSNEHSFKNIFKKFFSFF